jgi:hypothetical protein
MINMLEKVDIAFLNCYQGSILSLDILNIESRLQMRMFRIPMEQAQTAPQWPQQPVQLNGQPQRSERERHHRDPDGDVGQLDQILPNRWSHPLVSRKAGGGTPLSLC